MQLAIGFLLAIWILKKLLQAADAAIKRADYNRRLKLSVHATIDPEPDPDYIPDPDYEYEPGPSPDEIEKINERIGRLSGIIHDNYRTIAAIDKELSSDNIKLQRITALRRQKATIIEKIYKLELLIDKEKEKIE